MDGKQLDITEILSEHGSGSDGNEYLQLIDLTKSIPTPIILKQSSENYLTLYLPLPYWQHLTRGRTLHLLFSALQLKDSADNLIDENVIYEQQKMRHR